MSKLGNRLIEKETEEGITHFNGYFKGFFFIVEKEPLDEDSNFEFKYTVLELVKTKECTISEKKQTLLEKRIALELFATDLITFITNGVMKRCDYMLSFL